MLFPRIRDNVDVRDLLMEKYRHDLMEPVEYLHVPLKYNLKLKTNIKMQNKMNKKACPEVFSAHLERNQTRNLREP